MFVEGAGGDGAGGGGVGASKLPKALRFVENKVRKVCLPGPNVCTFCTTNCAFVVANCLAGFFPGETS